MIFHEFWQLFCLQTVVRYPLDSKGGPVTNVLTRRKKQREKKKLNGLLETTKVELNVATTVQSQMKICLDTSREEIRGWERWDKVKRIGFVATVGILAFGFLNSLDLLNQGAKMTSKSGMLWQLYAYFATTLTISGFSYWLYGRIGKGVRTHAAPEKEKKSLRDRPARGYHLVPMAPEPIQTQKQPQAQIETVEEALPLALLTASGTPTGASSHMESQGNA